ncbi:siderophore-interacting protein [Pseudoclavibacter sp. VKM Ac-2888]|uniref:siderophore-interacting protein n=1 Tax=Pseudoclavibacter sp. VKM Ac-2888 TaxID=2783830 RepID=UPI00188C6008|nr:siderophore-interacting protein [Pseudoclavibacter sp. VKM Ac-2888]MBF4551518.1 siderophore-interacting protein [Pseudoclavibacter sp. VKM Ac-2888]
MATIRDRIRELSQGRAILIDDFVEVVASRRLTPGFQRVTLGGACLADYTEPLPADAFKIDIGSEANPLIRGFTVRDFRAERLQFDFDVALHEAGRASDWSQTVAVGQRVRFLGFRRDFAVGDGVTEHVFIADASALPATAAILESLPTGHRVALLAETGSPEDRALLSAAIESLGDRLRVVWLTGRSSQGLESALVSAARNLTVPPHAQVWLAAESATVRSIRRHLIEGLGVPRGNLHATAYWISGLTSSQRDGREAVIYGEAVDAGLDVMDPVVYDRLEFEDA